MTSSGGFSQRWIFGSVAGFTLLAGVLRFWAVGHQGLCGYPQGSGT